jgi:ribosomal-protein-alanine N-acetyltransferase
MFFLPQSLPVCAVRQGTQRLSRRIHKGGFISITGKKRMQGMDIIIANTSDQKDFEICASMMTRTDPWITLGMDYGQCLKAFDGDCKEIYVARSGGEIEGFVILQVCGTFSGYIQTICISENHRGKGIGTRLIGFCEKRTLEFSPNIFICVSSFNKGAHDLYRRLGFELVGILENFVKEGFDELLLRKTVGPRVGYHPGKKNL